MEKDINNKLLIQLWKEFLVLNNFSNVEDALEEFLKCCRETISRDIDEYENMLELTNNNDEEEDYEELSPVNSIDSLLIKEVYDLEFELMEVKGELEDVALENGDVAFVDDKDIKRQLRLTNMLGSLYLTQNFYQKAIDCFSLVLKVNPSDKYDVKYKLGKAYLYSDMEEELLKLVKSYDYMKYFANNKLPKQEFKKIDRKFNFEKELFKGIENKIYIFRNNGFYTREDFAEVNKKDVLKLEGIGEKTILKLIQNGVKFKK